MSKARRKGGKPGGPPEKAAGPPVSARTPPAPTQPPTPRPPALRVLIAVAAFAPLALLVFLFLLLKAYSLPIHPSDEGIYFYGAKRMAEGALPYRDFFFAHPPVHLIVPALLFKLTGGYHFLVAKSVATFSAAFEGVAACLLVRKLARPGTPRWLVEGAAVLAAAAILLSESLLKASATMTGINLAGAFLAGAALLLAHRRPLAAGIVAGLATMTLIQAAPVAAVLAVAAWRQGRRPALRYCVGGAALVVLVHIVFLLIAGGAFLDQVYFYHLAKVGHPGEGSLQVGYLIVDNWTLFVSSAIGALALALARRPWVTALAAAAVLLQIIAMATRPRVFPFYFQPAFVPAAVALGLGLTEIGSGLLRGAGSPLGRVRAGVLAAFLVLLMIPLRGPATPVFSSRRAEQLDTYAKSYRWVDAPLIGSWNGIIRSLFWQGGERVAGEDYNAVTQYLWQRSRYTDTYPALVAKVRELEAASPGLTLFGDSSLAPSVALDAGVRIPGDFVDTNIERFRSGVVKFATVAALLDAHPLTTLLIDPKSGIGSLPEMQAYIGEHYVEVARFGDHTGDTQILYQRAR